MANPTASSSTDQVVQWVQAWAASNGFDGEALASAFRKEDIDGEILFELDFNDEATKNSLGLTLKMQKKLSKEVSALKGGTPSAPAAAAPAPHLPASPSQPPSKAAPPPASRRIPEATTRSGGKLEALRIVQPITAQMNGESPAAGGGGAENQTKVEINMEEVGGLIDQMLERAEVGDIEVAVVSVMGKFRGGKSFLLNLLTQYFLWLEQHQESLREHPRQPDESWRMTAMGEDGCDWLPDWLPDQIETPFEVDAKSDTNTCTKGLWILNRPFFLKKPDSNDTMAVLILDSQGADDGQLDEAQSRAILGITTVFSSVCIYNVRMPLDTKHVKDLSDLSNIFQLAVNDVRAADGNVASSRFGKLQFFLRDARFDAGSSLQACQEKLTSDTARWLDPSKAVINKDRVQQLHNSFEEPFPAPYGLCHPGDEADFMKAKTTKTMKMISNNFKHLLDEFVRSSFEVNFPVPVKRCLAQGEKKELTASTFVEYLDRIKTAFAGCMVAGGDPELVMMHKEEGFEEEFKKIVQELQPEKAEDFPMDQIQEKRDELLLAFEKSLGKLNPKSVERWKRKFDEFMSGYVAQIKSKFDDKKGHGDRAVASVAVGGMVMTSPLGGIVLAHWTTTVAAAIVATAVGYIRHAKDNNMSLERPEAVQSFTKVSVERCNDMIRSCKRMFGKAMVIANTFMAGKAAAFNNSTHDDGRRLH